MRTLSWALVGLLYATGVQAAVTVTWQPNREPDLAGYIVQYATACNGTFTDLATTRQPSFLDAGHDDGAYRILAYDTTGNRSKPSPCQAVAVPPAIVTTVTPSATGAVVRWTGTATRLRYASDDTTGWVELTSILPTQGTYTHSRPWSRKQSWVCYQAEDFTTGQWTEQGCNNFSSVVWEPGPVDPPEPPPVPDPPAPPGTPPVFTIDEQGTRVTLTYSAVDCPRGITRTTTGNKTRVLTLTCLK